MATVKSAQSTFVIESFRAITDLEIRPPHLQFHPLPPAYWKDSLRRFYLPAAAVCNLRPRLGILVKQGFVGRARPAPKVRGASLDSARTSS